MHSPPLTPAAPFSRPGLVGNRSAGTMTTVSLSEGIQWPVAPPPPPPPRSAAGTSPEMSEADLSAHRLLSSRSPDPNEVRQAWDLPEQRDQVGGSGELHLSLSYSGRPVSPRSRSPDLSINVASSRSSTCAPQRTDHVPRRTLYGVFLSWAVLAVTQVTAVVVSAASDESSEDGGLDIALAIICAFWGIVCAAIALAPTETSGRDSNLPSKAGSALAVAAVSSVLAVSIPAHDAPGAAVLLQLAAQACVLPLCGSWGLAGCTTIWSVAWAVAVALGKDGTDFESCFTPLRAGLTLQAALALHHVSAPPSEVDRVVRPSAIVRVPGFVPPLPEIHPIVGDSDDHSMTTSPPDGAREAVQGPRTRSPRAKPKETVRVRARSPGSVGRPLGVSQRDEGAVGRRRSVVGSDPEREMAQSLPVDTARRRRIDSMASIVSEAESVNSTASAYSYVAHTIKGFEGNRTFACPAERRVSVLSEVDGGHRRKEQQTDNDDDISGLDAADDEGGEPTGLLGGRAGVRKPRMSKNQLKKRAVSRIPSVTTSALEEITQRTSADSAKDRPHTANEPVSRAASLAMDSRLRRLAPDSNVVLSRTSLGQTEGTVTHSQPLEPCSPNQPPCYEQAVVETRELVRAVIGQGFDGENPGGQGLAPSPFRSLPPQTLQSLVMLFSRLSEELDTFRAQQFITCAVCEFVKCDRASIFLAEWKRKEIWTISNEGVEIRVPMDKSLVGYAALHNKMLNIKDAYSDPRFNTDVDKRTGYVTRNLLVYPISRGLSYAPGAADDSSSGDGRAIAVIQAINKNSGDFSMEDEGLLALFGKQAAIHLSNAQVLSQLRVNQNKARTMLELSKEIGDVKIALGAMMARIMTRARQVLTVERASVFLIDEEKQELWSIVTDAETVAQLHDSVIRFPVGVGLAGHVAVTGEMLNIRDVYQCGLFNPEVDRKTGFVTRTTLCVPIKSQHINKVMGVIQFINKANGDHFHEEDEDLALSFSSFVGISLNNVILYDELAEGKLVREQNTELRRLRQEAEQAAEAKSNFLMAMSHEIRTPMSGVIGMCELLSNTPLTDEQREMNDTIRHCGEALLAVINDVLDYGKIGAGKLELEQRDFSAVSLAEETIDVLRSKTEAKCITVSLEVATDMYSCIVGDSYRLRQIIINLMGNACKFTPQNGSITVTLRPWEEQQQQQEGQEVEVYFAVTDTGIGISEEAQQRLFRPFEQAEAGTTRQYGGTGLGLAICKQLVEAMNGQIGITSRLGDGATFWFVARFGRAEKCEALSQAVLRGLPTLPRVGVLVACAHEKQGELCARYFRMVGSAVLVVGSVPDLLSALRRMPSVVPEEAPSAWSELDTSVQIPTVVLIDDSCAGTEGDGLSQVLQELAEMRNKIPEPARRRVLNVCVATTLGMKVERGATLQEQGVVQVVTKPPKIDSLVRLCLLGIADAQVVQKGLAEQGPGGRQPVPAGMKLLVAEDNPTNQLLIRKQMAAFGIQPTVCENGQIAVDTLLREHHQVVFMDCHMPVLDGYSATQKIRELEAEGKLSAGCEPITIVALTADALPNTRQVCLDSGMNDYATKPLRKAQLAAVLDKYWFRQ
eukprot:TRINITY_DN5009_c0_g2_i1.p1 TRINITY_DN5009_c0_g2~~TRINITY_DN5009_c0_g2_i1.p1  ORF type:complete len:1586 (+),score=568.87 TRINITY_DN5009_c0_g2_i1:43-4800(+)